MDSPGVAQALVGPGLRAVKFIDLGPWLGELGRLRTLAAVMLS